MNPQPWSFTRIEKFENCPRQFYEESINPDRVRTPATREMLWGRDVHKSFENYLLHGSPLTAELATHAEFLDRFKALPGDLAGEEEIALDVNLRPCGKWDKKVWYRGQVDARKRYGPLTIILDHKTGKHKSDFLQLKSFALHEFLARPETKIVRAEYYWTQIKGTNGETYHRENMWDLFRAFGPALLRYNQAFRTETWIPKPSGLCNGWCSVTSCEYWRPKRKPR